jgi:hypothetical protein
MERATERREEANRLFNDGSFKEARDAYTAALEALMSTPDSSAERVRLLGNRSVCSLRLGDADSAINDATDAIALDHGFAKGYFRRAQAFRARGLAGRAIADLQTVVKLEPGSKAAQSLIQEILAEGKAASGAGSGAVAKLDELVEAARRSAPPPGVAGVSAEVDFLVGQMVKQLSGSGSGGAAIALCAADGPSKALEAFASTERLAPVALLAALRRLMGIAGDTGVAAVSRAVAKSWPGVWPRDADGSSGGRFSTREVEGEAARLMMLSDVAAEVQGPLVQATEHAEAYGTGERAAAALVLSALSTAIRTDDVTACVGVALRAITHTLRKPSGVRVEEDVDCTGGSSKVREVGRLSPLEAALHGAVRVLRTRSAADVAVALGLHRLLAAVCTTASARVRRVAEGALTRLLERVSRPKAPLPSELTSLVGGTGAIPEAAVLALQEWRRRRRHADDVAALEGVSRAVVGDAVHAEAEAGRERRALEAREDEKSRAKALRPGGCSADEDGAPEAAAAARAARAEAREEEERRAAAWAVSLPLETRFRAAVTLSGVFLVNRDVALRVCGWSGVLPAVFSLSMAPDVGAQAACVEVLGHLAADSDGREMVGEEGWGSLRRLAELGTTSIRAAALVTLARSMATARSTVASSAPEAASELGKDGEDGGPSAEEVALLESYEAAARSLRLAVGGRAEELAASAGSSKERMGGVDPLDTVNVMTLAADPEGLFAVTVRATATVETVDAYGRTEVSEDSLPRSGVSAIIASSARAIEALAVLCSRTAVKRALAADRPTLRAMMGLAGALSLEAEMCLRTPLGGGALVTAEWGPCCLGVCFCIYALSVSEQERQERSLAEKDVTPAQWQQFQKLTMGGGGRDAERDPPEDVDERMRRLLGVGALGTLHRLAGASSLGWRAARASILHTPGEADEGMWVVSSSRGAHQAAAMSDTDRLRREEDEKHQSIKSSGALQFVAAALQNMSSRFWCRRLLAGGGGIQLALRLSSEDSGNTLAGRTLATHALAQILVATDPALLADATRMDCVNPLLSLTRSPSGLQCFEATLALTNIASHGLESAMRVVRLGGLKALEDVQFCDHVRLRRAGTEAIANLAVTPQGAGLISGERLDLWLALIRGYGEDVETAVAAAGGLAMSLGMDDGDPLGEDDPSAGGRVRVLTHPKGVRSLCCAVVSGHAPLQHRALAALHLLAKCPATSVRAWEVLSTPMELGDVDAVPQEHRASDTESLPASVHRHSAAEVASVVSSSAPPEAGVAVSALQLAALLAAGEGMPDLTEEGESVRKDPTPEVQSTAAALLEEIREAAKREGAQV